jgi:hypothetical protein
MVNRPDDVRVEQKKRIEKCGIVCLRGKRGVLHAIEGITGHLDRRVLWSRSV